MTNYRRLIFALSGFAGSCGGSPAVGEVRTVMLPARPANCPLELVAVQPDDMAPGHRFGGGGQYQMIGAITLGLDRGTDVMSEPIRALVRSRACAMGGEVVSLLATGDSAHYVVTSTSIFTKAQTDAVFTVWGPHVATSGPQAF